MTDTNIQEQSFKKSVKLQLHTKQIKRGEMPAYYETTTQGILYKKGTAIFVTYEETNQSGLESSKTTLKIDPLLNEVTVIRFGGTQMRYVWKRGTVSHTSYQTPFGTFDLTIKTEQLQFHFEENLQSGKLNVEYQMKFGGENSRMLLQLQFHEITDHCTEHYLANH
ncbi:DUF1934 domain-containing protein [Fodinisporobacter ferrooxydans]|uniref:DUF1934 domain-containing protein n=1 Tax=Fodinisporobacter ferrooxydans TaxID=2901836 RepID=A0ABY4CMA4_9BACL|nr:DUF1934 domain-containing protein [Alicyclobacillaceae bacterium MYW30-H2]